MEVFHNRFYKCVYNNSHGLAETDIIQFVHKAEIQFAYRFVILHRCVTDNTYIMQKQWIHGLSMHHRRDSYTPLSDADNSKPVLFPAYISNTDNLCWNCLVTNGYINGEQIPRASSAFFALSVDFFDVVSASIRKNEAEQISKHFDYRDSFHFFGITFEKKLSNLKFFDKI